MITLAPTLHVIKNSCKMKLGIKLPHSLELSLSATAKAVANQDVIINTFVILCEMHDDTP